MCEPVCNTPDVAISGAAGPQTQPLAEWIQLDFNGSVCIILVPIYTVEYSF